MVMLYDNTLVQLVFDDILSCTSLCVWVSALPSPTQCRVFTCLYSTSLHAVSIPHRCLSSDGECEWRYSGNGIEYQLLAGPIFMLVFTLSAVPLGLVAGYQRVNRKLILGIGALLWSLTTLTTSFSQAFWTLAVLRAGLGML